MSLETIVEEFIFRKPACSYFKSLIKVNALTSVFQGFFKILKMFFRHLVLCK